MAFKKFKIGDKAIVWNCIQFNKDTGGIDLPNGGNNKYFQEAEVINVRLDRYNRWLADVKFESGLISNGHFQDGMKRVGVCFKNEPTHVQ